MNKDLLKIRLRLLRKRLASRKVWGSLWSQILHSWMVFRVSSPRKVWNWLLAKSQRYLKSERVFGMPFRYTIDPVNYCVLRCPLCPTGQGTLGRPAGKLRLVHYKSIIDMIYPYTYYLDLFNWGEPFLHPNIIEFIRYASQRDIMVRISSNMNVFSEELAVGVVQAGLTDLVVDVDGATQETYELYRRGGNLDMLIDHVRMVVSAKKRLRSVTPLINARMLVTRKNEHQVGDVRALVESAGVELFSVTPIFIQSDSQSDAEEWLPQDSSYLAYADRADVKNTWDCADLWEGMTINWDGSVLPCCWIHDSRHDFGNILSVPLRDLWNNAHYVAARRALRRRQRDKATVCGTCLGNPQYRYRPEDDET
jgi:radical SAM protein with 4Fe4S-binding SPASM domain